MKNIIIVAHKFTPQPDDDLVLYLNTKKYDNVLHIYHGFTDAPNRKSVFKWYKRGKIYKQNETIDFIKWPELFIYLKELYFTIKWIFKTKLIWDKYIGMDGLCTNIGLFLKFIGKAKLVIYWAIDFVPEKRFSQKFKNKIYELINVNGYKNADEMWDLSPRMAEARKKFLRVDESMYKRRKVVPYGVWNDRIKRYSYSNCQKDTLVFMGHLLEKQGVQLVLKAIPLIISKNPDFKFKIIGTGRYENTVKKIIKDLNIEKYCIFMGKIDDKIMENEIAKSTVAIAPYIKSLDTWTYYADPGKIKKYLACGVPVILTEIPWNSHDIENNKCGLITSENEIEIAGKILKLMDKEINNQFRNNAIKYSKSFEYEHIFKDANI